MIYFEKDSNEYIISFGQASATINTEITKERYEAIKQAVSEKPSAEGNGYRLKTDLTWEEYDLPVPSEDDELSDEEALSIITGEPA